MTFRGGTDHGIHHSLTLTPGKPRRPQHDGTRRQGSGAPANHRHARHQPPGRRPRDPWAAPEGLAATRQLGRYLLIPPEMGPEALGESNILALASRIADPYYFGYGTAAKHYGFTTQHRQVIRLVTPVRTRNRRVLDTEVRIVNSVQRKFFGFGPVDVLGYSVMMSDREKTVIDCIDRPSLAGGEGEAATILATACRRIDWHKAVTYLERMSSKTLTRRFGWLAERAGATFPDDVRAHLNDLAKGSGKAFFGPRIPRPGAIGYQDIWQLTVNIASHELRDSAGIARRHSVDRER